MKAMKVQDDMEEASYQNRAESPKTHNNQPQKIRRLRTKQNDHPY
jgi:hypothetical protein